MMTMSRPKLRFGSDVPIFCMLHLGVLEVRPAFGQASFDTTDFGKSILDPNTAVAHCVLPVLIQGCTNL